MLTLSVIWHTPILVLLKWVVVLVCARLLPILCKLATSSQMLNKKQVSKLQKAAKIAALLATDDVPFHKHPDFVAGSHPPLPF